VKSITLIFLLLSSFAYGQRKLRPGYESSECIIGQGDSLETAFRSTSSQLKVIVDTFYSEKVLLKGEASARDISLVKYFVDSLNKLKVIELYEAGYAHFLFYCIDGHIRKAKSAAIGWLMYTQYYYSEQNIQRSGGVKRPIDNRLIMDYHDVLDKGIRYLKAFQSINYDSLKPR
jgi:hypothetical protein